MTLQGPGDEAEGPRAGLPDDETRTDWQAPGGVPGEAAPDAPIPAAPPPPPGADVPGPTAALPPVPPPPPSAPPPEYGLPPAAYGAPQPGGPAPVTWAPPEGTVAPSGLEVPGAPGLRFGSVLHRVLAFWIDGILVGIGAGILAGIAGTLAGGSLVNLITMVIFLGAEFLYFVGLWTSDSRATLGMRVMKLQIGRAFDGRTLTIQQAVIRWVALGLPFQALGYVPELAPFAGLAGLWTLVLLISTAVSPTRQGIHDRLAGSAIVQPVSASTPAVACLVLLLLLLVLPLIAIVSLIFLGTQVSEIVTETSMLLVP